jgi:hypothetical protein
VFLTTCPFYFSVLHCIDGAFDILNCSLDGVQRVCDRFLPSAMGENRSRGGGGKFEERWGSRERGGERMKKRKGQTERGERREEEGEVEAEVGGGDKLSFGAEA